MKTAKEIIAYLEAELADATKKQTQAKGKDLSAYIFFMQRAMTIKSLLQEIKE